MWLLVYLKALIWAGVHACIVSHSLVNANNLFRTEASSVITEACSH